MHIIRHLNPQLQPLALAIGNFDGMHMGHAALIRSLVEAAKNQNLTPAVMTFEPHPREFFSPQNAPARLSSLREKLEWLCEASVETILLRRFNQPFAQMSAPDFINVLHQLNVKAILVGEDFRFGAKRAGGVADFSANGFELIPMPRIDLNEERVSSTRVRNALATGNLKLAKTLLHRDYSISGKVVHGEKRGRKLGFPTANIHMRHERPALTGVYAVKLEGLAAVANLGVRPTINGIPKLMLEVHVLDYQGDLYGKHVHVAFLHKIRDEMKFASLDDLKAQIAQDILVARDYFKKTT